MRVLIAEDDGKLAGALARGLRAEGHAVDVAATGDEALFSVRVTDYDVVILDVMLPGPDGVEVCRTMRQEGRWAAVLMLTARDGVSDRVRGLDAGADDYLVKPFAYDELLARLRSVVRRGAPARPPVLCAGALQIDPASRCVTHAGDEVAVTAKEFALLEYLVRHAGRVVTRTELLEHVWDVNYGGSGNVVDVYIGYLRRKLRDADGTTPIVTIRGAGFMVDHG